MKEKNFGNIGNRIAYAAQHGISAIKNFFEKKVEKNQVEHPVERPVELPVEQTPIIAERMDKVEIPQVSEQVKITKVRRLVEHDTYKSELKVIGKIDLDALNQRTRPVKKSRRQLKKERREREN
jgi:translation initiation factor IF-2